MRFEEHIVGFQTRQEGEKQPTFFDLMQAISPQELGNNSNESRASESLLGFASPGG